MDRNEILATIRNLANSQGFYGRGDAVDLVLYFEC